MKEKDTNMCLHTGVILALSGLNIHNYICIGKCYNYFVYYIFVLFKYFSNKKNTFIKQNLVWMLTMSNT